MSLFERLDLVIKSNLNDLINKLEDPEKILDQAVKELDANVKEMRQAVGIAVATYKKTERRFKDNQKQINTWQKRAELAMSKGDEKLALEALIKKKPYSEACKALDVQLQEQKEVVKNLQHDLRTLEQQFIEAKNKKYMLQARASAAKSKKESRNIISGNDSRSALSAFERMEDKIIQLEAESQVAGQLEAGIGLEEQFRQLEAEQEIQDELAMLRAKLPGATPSQPSLPTDESANDNVRDPAIDAELEKMRSELKDN